MTRFVAVALLCLLVSIPGSGYAISVGDKAPPFEAPSTAGTVRLSDYAGKRNVVLVFYFADFTPV